MRFDSYHPAIHLIFFAFVIPAAVFLNQPVFLLLSLFCSFSYAQFLGGKKTGWFSLFLLLLMIGFTLFYASYHHFGVTDLAVNIIGNPITLESLVYGMVLSISMASVVLWFRCLHQVVSSDQIIYLLGRIWPKLSLFVAITLRLIPHIKAQAKRIHLAQKSIGRGFHQGNLFLRIRNFFRVFSILVTWTLEYLIEATASMKSRGYSLPGRTAFSIYRFDGRDRILVIWLCACVSTTFMAVLLDQTTALYNPAIVLNAITPLGYLFYLFYLLFCLTPMLVEWIGRQRQRRLCQKG